REEHVGCNAWLFPPLHLGIGGLLQAREESIELRLYVPGVTRGLTPTLLLGLREGGAELRAARREAGDQRGVVRRQLLDRGLRGAREPARQLLPRGCALAGVAFLRRGRAGGGAGVRRGHGREQDETKDDVGRPIDFRGCHATPPDWSL